MISKNNFNELKTLKNNKIKKAIRVFETKIQIFFHDFMYKIKNFDNEKIKIKTSKNFQKFIIFYNNVFFL